MHQSINLLCTPTWLTATMAAALLAIGSPPARAELIPQSPSPTGRNLGGVAFVSPTHGFIVGDNHHLLETLDAGESWSTRMATGFSTDPFYTIHFYDALHGYLAGNNQDAYRTTDGGATWTPMPTMLGGSVRALNFITPSAGFAGYNGAISWTADGGTTWELRGVYPDAPIVFGMDFRDANVGLVCGIRSSPHNDGGIYRTEDGGLTWSFVFDGYANDVLWIDDLSALAVSGADVVRTDDAGLTWNLIASGWITTGASEIARAGETSTLGAVSASGDIWLSTDLGLSWFQVVQGIGVLPANWTISFYDAEHGWVVGANGLTYRTTDGGFSWRLMNSGCGDEVTDIDFADDEFGVAVTHRGFLFRTQNRGARWDVRRLRETGIVFGREEGFRTVEVVDPQVMFAGGAGGILFRSEDGGESWFNYGFPYQLDFAPDFEIRDICFTDRFNGWLGGFYGNGSLYHTTDSGFNWTRVDPVGGSIVAVDAEGDRVWAATAGNVIHRSFNQGQSWTAATLPGNVYYLSDIEFVDLNNGWAVSWYGYMAKTTNGGVTWTPQEYSQNETYFDVERNGPSELLVVGYDHNTFRYFQKKSTNGGASWTRTELSGFEEWFSCAHLRPTGRFWLGGSFGKIVCSPAAPLAISLPNDTPQQVPPAQAVDVAVRIVAGEEQILPGSETLWLRRATTGDFEPIPLAILAPEAYVATLPEMLCTDTPQFYFSAQGAGGATVTLPETAPTSLYTTNVGVIEPADLLVEDFESGLPTGWSTTGLWHVTSACAPPGACGGGNRVYFGQEANCQFNTGVRVAGVLRSPLITLPPLQAGDAITLTFCSALDTEYPDGAYGDDDQSQVWFVSGTQQSPLAWLTDHSAARQETLSLNQHAGRTGRIEWRFDSMNDYLNGYRGWHVDNVRLTGPALVCNTVLPADVNCDGIVNFFDIDPFLLTLFDPAAYAALYPDCDPLSADVNEDGLLNFFDIDPFVSALFP